MEAVLYSQQLQVASDAADLQHDQIRQQQVQLRLEQNQGEIARTQQLRRVLASEEVQVGTRNIAPGSGTIRAITEENLQNFLKDQNADRLNFLGKQSYLNIEDQMVDVKKRAMDINATAGFLKEVENIVVAAATGGAGGAVGGAGAAGGAGAGNLIDYGSNMNLNA